MARVRDRQGGACLALSIPQRPLQALLLAPPNPATTPCGSGLLGGAQEAGGARRSGAVSWVRWVARGGVSLAALPPCLLCLCWSVCPALPQPSLLSHLSSVPCPLGPEQADPGHAWSPPHCQLCSDATARLQVEGSATAPAHPAQGTLGPTSCCSGGRGAGLGACSYPGLRFLSTCSRRTPDPQHSLSRARGPLLARRSTRPPRLPPSQ